MKRINMWSGPRNVSTALMYAFAQRPDTRVVDEPYYAHYLLTTGADHPGREEVLEDQSTDVRQITDELLSGYHNGELLFIKNMAHHMTEMGKELTRLMDGCEPVFLIRDPHEMLLSLDQALPDPSLRDTAYKRLHELFEMARDRGKTPLVIDSRELLKNPKKVLSELCRQLDINFDNGMLSWEKGALPEDGIWARYWYQSVHQSNGFNKYTPKDNPVPERLKPLLDRCKPYYDKLFAHAIK